MSAHSTRTWMREAAAIPFPAAERSCQGREQTVVLSPHSNGKSEWEDDNTSTTAGASSTASGGSPPRFGGCSHGDQLPVSPPSTPGTERSKPSYKDIAVRDLTGSSTSKQKVFPVKKFQLGGRSPSSTKRSGPATGDETKMESVQKPWKQLELAIPLLVLLAAVGYHLLGMDLSLAAMADKLLFA